MKILIIGSGGREHAIARRLARDPESHELHAAPGNPGIGALAELHPAALGDIPGLADLAGRLTPDLVVVGPEAPLVAGLADELAARGIPVFGPTAAAAQLEGSKSFAKEVMEAAGVPTAAARTVSRAEDLESALDAVNPTGDVPHVVKADGLAAGKGVVVTAGRATALAHGLEVIGAGGSVVVEEFLDGPEVSLFCITDGEAVVPLAPAQDFKRALDGDEGPNTGGMGAYSPLPWAPGSLVAEVVETVVRPTLAEMRHRGAPFAGLLYCGLALTARGVKVVEFNARFGDPETQVVLERLESPLAPLLLGAATGTLTGAEQPVWSTDAAVTVVVASEGYPASARKGDPIDGLAEVEGLGAHVIHAGTAHDVDGHLVSAGGRVLAVIARGKDLAAARDLATRGADLVRLKGSHHRTDIARAAAKGEVGKAQREAGPTGDDAEGAR